MTLNISLDPVSIMSAVARLQQTQQNIQLGVKDLIEILTRDGAMVAQAADGSMADVTFTTTDITGVISAGGEAPIIAEFGAGDATLTSTFENPPPVDVYPGSYSFEVGTQEYFTTGKWHFGGNTYTEVPAHQGMAIAKAQIESDFISVAQGVIKL